MDCDHAWQNALEIGDFDRSAREFRNGDDARHYEMFKRYAEQFPDDVAFTSGKSDIKRDWNYAQWTWYRKTPVWKIHFNQATAPTGKAILTLGFASSQPIKGNLTNMQVKVNANSSIPYTCLKPVLPVIAVALRIHLTTSKRCNSLPICFVRERTPLC